MELDVFFKPGSVAVFGASRHPEKPGRVIFENLRKGGFRGGVYPVNPRADEIDGLKVYTPEELPDVDLAVFAIRADFVPEALESVADRVKGALIVAGGFGEVGRKDLDRRLLGIAERHDVRIWGPNCLGTMDAHSKMNATFIPLERMKMPVPGGISILSQSGATVASMVDWANERGLGIAKVASYGNQLDVSDWEILEYLEKDRETKAIGFYVEGLKDGRKLIELGDVLNKPVVYLKAGRGKGGVAAARSHTGALAGNYSVYRGVFRQMGFGEARNVEEFLDALEVLERWTLAGKKVGILTCGGGFGVMATDSVEENGLELATWSEETLQGLKQIFPDRVVLRNPMDLTGDSTPEMFAEALDELEKEDVDAIIVILLFQLPRLNERIASALKGRKKPVLVVSPPGEVASKFNRLIDAPLFSTPEKAVRALAVAISASEKVI